MASRLEFLTANPAQAAFEHGQDRAQEAEERRREDAIDRAYREGLAEMYGPAEPVAPPQGLAGGGMQAPDRQPAAGMGGAAPEPDRGGGRTSSFGPVLSRLVAVPGGGREAMELSQADRRRQEEIEGIAIKALADGDMTTFNYWAPRAGLNLPPEVLSNAQARSLIGQALKLAKDFYGNDEAQAARFVDAFIRSGGNAQAAYGAAGAPRGRRGSGLAGGSRPAEVTPDMRRRAYEAVASLEDEDGNRVYTDPAQIREQAELLAQFWVTGIDPSATTAAPAAPAAPAAAPESAPADMFYDIETGTFQAAP